MTIISPAQIWDENAQQIARILGPENVRAVGGCVRDALMQRVIGDIDLATVFTPQDVTQKLEEKGIAVKPTGVEHGTVTAVMHGVHYEITTLREDVETHGRRAVVKYTTDWAIDAQRRDFTVNAFYLDMDGDLYDGSGQGAADLQTETLRFIGDAATRIQEDYLRILRLFRFTAQLGFTPDDAALEASAQEKEGLKLLSGERVTMEWDKLLAAPYADKALGLMQEAGIDALFPFQRRVLPTGPGSMALRYVLAFEDKLADMPFVFSRKQIAQGQMLLSLRDSKMGWQECAYRHGKEMAEDLYLWRCITNSGDKAISQETIEAIRAYDIPVSPVTSEKYIKQGLSGENLGRQIKQDNEAWILEYFGRD